MAWRHRYRDYSRDYSHLNAPKDVILAKAIEACAFAGGSRWEFYVNRDLLTLFGKLQQVALPDVVERYLDMLQQTRGGKRQEPTPFNHDRAGNLVGWGFRLGLLSEVTDPSGHRAWKLVACEMQWDVHKGRARQIRGLPPGEQAAMDRKRETERKRAATLARKHAAKIAPQIKMDLDEILHDDPETMVGEKFAEFLEPWFEPPVALHVAYGILVIAHHGWPKDKQQRWKTALGRETISASYRAMERRRAQPELISDDDAAVLDDLI
ncbi:hypothetical protein ACFOYU_11510 [Microvirga sp. GCM10011540]|uniref:hypothetical protein n=1 Tax=Microvirga sp. GCM10011540 TaxID=3317338 RepID=UPI00360F647A